MTLYNPGKGSSTSPVEINNWFHASITPELYQLAQLLFEDGSTRRGTWNGKMWWGYDERVRRSRALAPVAWRPLL
jgi:hypothetical protein